MSENEKIDHELIACVVLEMTDRIKLIMKLFPKSEEKQNLLRNLAAASIHLAFFMRDIFTDSEGKEIKELEEHEKVFLNECGCKKND